MSKFTKVENNSKSIKRGSFKREELETYGVDTKDIDIIMEYQKKLPILQEDDGNWIDARVLHGQLGVKRDFSHWVKEQIYALDLEVESDFCTSLKTSKQKGRGGHNKIEYFLKTEIAKEVAMIAGLKGGRTSKELKEMSKLVRKYFITIERVFKDRKNWNFDRIHTTVECEELKHQLARYNKDLFGHPDWMHNKYVAEFHMLNEIIIGMSAKEYRKIHKLKKSESTRNAFTEEQLEYVHELERNDVDLIGIQNIFDYNERHRILSKKFSVMRNKNINKIA